MPARKSAKKSATKKAAPKKKAAARKKAAPKASEKTDASESSDDAAPSPSGDVAAKDVNLGHVFALRPRVPTSFRQPDFLRAKELLSEERYENTTAAARAVAEKALELTHDGPQGKHGKKGKRGV